MSDNASQLSVNVSPKIIFSGKKNVRRDSNPALVQGPTRDCFESKIHQETLEMGFHGRLAQLGAAATGGLVNPLDEETSESFD